MALFLGIDLGTSGVRMSVINAQGDVVSDASVAMDAPILIDDRPCQDASIWWSAVQRCLRLQSDHLAEQEHTFRDVAALAVDGTSGTLLMVDADLNPLSHGYMYNSARFHMQAEMIARYAPENCLARGGGSGLARLLFLQEQAGANAAFALHQADWISARLMQRGGLSDETNVLKTGFDVQRRQWPDWIESCGVNTNLLPQVKPVGDTFGVIDPAVASEFGFANDTRVVAGTTDSNAAFLASGANKIGDAVTSLGTTLAIKLLSDKPVVDPSRGIYSHRIKNMWLPGGASNTGGGVLLDYFTPQQMAQLQSDLEPSVSTGLDYYPLSRPGERFPIADADFPPRLEPRPSNDAVFFQAMLEGISEIEAIGYQALSELGAGEIKRIFTAGGGARNCAWSKIREIRLGIPVWLAASSEASVGTARIAADLVG